MITPKKNQEVAN